MTITTTHRSDGAGPTIGSRPPSLTVAASVTTFGTLSWIVWLWLLAIVGNTVALAAVVRWGSLDRSLWGVAGAGWQRWPIFAAGVTIAVAFVPMFVENGATRRLAARAAVVTMVVLAVVAAAIVTVGFRLEGLVFDTQDWPHTVDEGGRTIAGIGVPVLFVGYALSFGAYFVAGWLAAGAYRWRSWSGLLPGVLVALILVLVTEVFLVPTEIVLFNSAGGFIFDRLSLFESGILDTEDSVSLAWRAPVAAAVIAAGTAIASRITREIPID